MNSINSYNQQRSARSAIFVCRVLLGSLTIISLSSSLAASPSLQQQLFRRSDDATVIALSEPDHHQHIIRRNAPTATIPDFVASREEFRYGYPAPEVDIHVAARFVSAYDRRTRNPHWSAECLNKQNLLPSDPNNPPGRAEYFHEDTTIPEQFRAKLAAYTRSGYDRGLQASPADAKLDQAAMDETFVLSNIAPQIGLGFNRNYWAYLENFVRDLTNRFDHVYVITGPLYLNNGTTDSTGKRYVIYEVLAGTETTGPEVAVPTHFHKTILVANGEVASPSSIALGSFLLPNAAISNTRTLTDFITPVATVEAAAGVVFFDKVDRNGAQNLCDATTCAVIR